VIDIHAWLEVMAGKRELCGKPVDDVIRLPCVRPEGHKGECHPAR
jgi:hypothetical protein